MEEFFGSDDEFYNKEDEAILKLKTSAEIYSYITRLNQVNKPIIEDEYNIDEMLFPDLCYIKPPENFETEKKVKIMTYIIEEDKSDPETAFLHASNQNLAPEFVLNCTPLYKNYFYEVNENTKSDDENEDDLHTFKISIDKSRDSLIDNFDLMNSDIQNVAQTLTSLYLNKDARKKDEPSSIIKIPIGFNKVISLQENDDPMKALEAFNFITKFNNNETVVNIPHFCIFRIGKDDDVLQTFQILAIKHQHNQNVYPFLSAMWKAIFQYRKRFEKELKELQNIVDVETVSESLFKRRTNSKLNEFKVSLKRRKT